MALNPKVILSLGALLAAMLPSSALAQCALPHSIANGQIADASKVMDNLEAVADCADTAVTPTGTPTTGSIAVISGPKAITSGDLTGALRHLAGQRRP